MAVLGLLLAVGAAGCTQDKEPEPLSLAAGDSCPSFTVTTLDGAVVSKASLAGRRFMLVFFNTGCEDCRRDLPEVQRLYEWLGGDDDELAPSDPADGTAPSAPRILCVSRAEGAESVRAYWEANGFTMPVSAQETDDVYRHFATSVIPRVYIVSSTGVIAAAYAGGIPAAATLLELLR